MRRTLFILGPSGVGKSNIDELFPKEILRIDPYRLRKDGPRREQKNETKNEADRDLFYAHPRLKEELELIFQTSGEKAVMIEPETYWYRKFKTLIFKVRDTWQILNFLPFLNNAEGLAKAEVYTRLIPDLISLQDFSFLGKKQVVILNPFPKSIGKLDRDDLAAFLNIVGDNLTKRGAEDQRSIKKRTASVLEEIPVWLKLLSFKNDIAEITEIVGWEFAEHRYYTEDKADILVQAKKRLLSEAPYLGDYFDR